MRAEIAIAGGGYSGVKMASLLSDDGFDVVVFEGKSGGDIAVFNSLPEIKEHYIEYVEEYFELLQNVNIEKGVVRKAKKKDDFTVEIFGKEKLRQNFGDVIICTGCYDSNPLSAGIYGMRPAGIFSLENAMALISKGFRIGKNVLVFGNTAILEIFNSMLNRIGYSSSIVDGEYVVVKGKKRVEEVVIDGEKFKCDTLVYFKKRESFNPFKLEGLKAGNINAKTYDYKKVRKDVLRVFNSFKKD